MNLHVGMRKIKSLVAVFLSFLFWQVLCLFAPGLETHPVYAYIYSIIEMRETPEQTKEAGGLRIKATFIGLVVGLLFITLTISCTRSVSSKHAKSFIEIGLILIAVLCSLSAAELVKCKSFCGAAALITIICMMFHGDEGRYFYAIMRVLQTLIGVFSAIIVNQFVNMRKK